jgi:hypothetical protein
VLGRLFDLTLMLLRGPSRANGLPNEEDRRRQRLARERQKDSIRAQYSSWAEQRRLSPNESRDLWRGTIGGRAVRFDTGLAGAKEALPSIDVEMTLAIRSVSITRAHVPEVLDAALSALDALDEAISSGPYR